MRGARPGELARIGPYTVRARVGGGPTGTVYRADGADRRVMSVKVMHEHLMAVPGFRAGLDGQVSAVRAVTRRRLVPIVDADLAADLAWIARPWLPGRDLRAEVSRRELLGLPELTWLAIGLSEGLAALHAAGIVHRDLKPSNIVVARHGPRITDAGTSAALGARAFAGTDLVTEAAAFMPPERLRGRDLGPAGDVFSLGAVLAYAARGTGPAGNGAGLLATWHPAHDGEPDLAGVPDELRPLIRSCLSPDPGRRPTAREVRAALTYAELTPARPAPVARPVPVVRPQPQPSAEAVDDRVPAPVLASPVLASPVPEPLPPGRCPRSRSWLLFAEVLLPAFLAIGIPAIVASVVLLWLH